MIGEEKLNMSAMTGQKLTNKAPAKRWQHLNATYPYIVGPAFASSGQTIATFKRSRTNRSQHCWGQHVTRVWPPCCNVLRHVGS